MARYIDADLLKQCVQENITRYFTYGTGGYCLAEDVVEDIDAFPTADVVPKSEVEALIIDRNAARLGMIAEHERLNTARADVAREIFMDIDRVVEKYSMGDIEYPAFLDIIAELKKKYTEDQSDG